MATNIYLDGEYLENNPSWDVEDSPWKAEQIAAMLERNTIIPKAIGEIGCGAGEILVELQRRYPHARLKGYDISPQAIEICRDKANETLSFEFADLTKSRDVQFDLLLVIDVLEHVDDYPGFLSSIRDLSDVKVFHIPLDMTIVNIVFKDFILKQRRNVGHIHYFMKVRKQTSGRSRSRVRDRRARPKRQGHIGASQVHALERRVCRKRLGAARHRASDAAGIQRDPSGPFDPEEEGTFDYPPLVEDKEIAKRIVTWIRIRLPKPDDQSSGGKSPSQQQARLAWVGANAARVIQAVRVTNERLGMGTGLPDQVYKVANAPVFFVMRQINRLVQPNRAILCFKYKTMAAVGTPGKGSTIFSRLARATKSMRSIPNQVK